MSYAPRDAIDWKTVLSGNHSPFVTKPKQFHSVYGESGSKRNQRLTVEMENADNHKG
jgi:hypothetical protein